MRIFSHNLLATFYFNFKMLPWRQAIKFPFIFYGKVKFMRTSGNIKFTSTPNTGTVRIGAQGSEMFPTNTTVIDIAGTLEIEGIQVRIGRGTLIRIEDTGHIKLNNCRIGAKSIIFAEKLIDIGHNTGLSWNCQLMDSDRHCIIDIHSQVIKEKTKPIIIKDNCWIGNHVIINKGTIIPHNTIIASTSLCNKDYSKTILPYSILAGIPVKLISSGKRRLPDT